jgi:hypothetical protein
MPFHEILPESYPNVILADEQKPLAWNYGRQFNLMIASRFVRISARGMQFSKSIPRIAHGGHWNTLSCKPRADALCEHDSSIMFFPNGDVDIPPDTQFIDNSYTRKFPRGACTNPYSMRLLKLNDVRYEVSLCDLVDANLDVVYDVVKETLYWRQDSTTTSEYIIIGLVSIYFMSCISGNVIDVASGGSPQNIHKANLYLVLAAWLYLVTQLSVSAMAYVLTVDDLKVCCFLLVFVAVEGYIAWFH